MTRIEIDACNLRISAGEIRTKSGQIYSVTLKEGLIREDGKLVFPVANEIPVMLLEEALVLG